MYGWAPRFFAFGSETQLLVEEARAPQAAGSCWMWHKRGPPTAGNRRPARRDRPRLDGNFMTPPRDSFDPPDKSIHGCKKLPKRCAASVSYIVYTFALPSTPRHEDASLSGCAVRVQRLIHHLGTDSIDHRQLSAGSTVTTAPTEACACRHDEPRQAPTSFAVRARPRRHSDVQHDSRRP